MDRNLQYRKMHALLRDLGIWQSRPYLLEGYGVEHCRDLSDGDLQDLVDRLVKMKQEKLASEDLEKRRWRSNLLTVLNKYGIYVTNKDWTQVNRLLLDKRISGKLMYEMSVEELQKTCVRLRAIMKKKEETESEIDRIAKLN